MTRNLGVGVGIGIGIGIENGPALRGRHGVLGRIGDVDVTGKAAGGGRTTTRRDG